MRQIGKNKTTSEAEDDMLQEYRFDYSRARPNRFSETCAKDRTEITLDPDVATIFKDSESVNAVLRALITTMPRTKIRQKTARLPKP
jgi:hypothetical protein